MSYTHLTQIADSGVYITPDEPADPRDCARYPDSLYCGGQPFSRKLADLDPEIVNDECAFGVKITPILGFVKLPPIEAYYIKPECRFQKPIPPPPPIPESSTNPNNLPVSKNCNGGRYVIAKYNSQNIDAPPSAEPGLTDTEYITWIEYYEKYNQNQIEFYQYRLQKAMEAIANEGTNWAGSEFFGGSIKPYPFGKTGFNNKTILTSGNINAWYCDSGGCGNTGIDIPYAYKETRYGVIIYVEGATEEEVFLGFPY